MVSPSFFPPHEEARVTLVSAWQSKKSCNSFALAIFALHLLLITSALYLNLEVLDGVKAKGKSELTSV